MKACLRFAILTCTTLTCAVSLPAQWQMQDAHITADLRGIHSLGGGVAWASGTNGTVLRTEDAGFVWQLCAIPPGAEKLDFRGIQAFDHNTAIVLSSGKGDLSRLYKTTDGCQTWKLLFTNPDPEGFWDALVLQPTGKAWLLGDPVNNAFTLFLTEDSGNLWTRQTGPSLSASASQQGAFAASNSALIAASGGFLFGSGGTAGAFLYSRSVRLPIPVGQQTEASGVFSLASSQNDTLVAVGGDYTKPSGTAGTSAWSTDRGEHWHPATTPPHGYRSSVAYDPTHKAWITVGPNGTDLSTDDGRNWQALKPSPGEAPDTDQHWNALSLPYVVGPHGRIATQKPDALPSPKP